MTLTTELKKTANRLLKPLNLRLETWTAERSELGRLRELEANGHFERAIFPNLFSERRYEEVLEAVLSLKNETRKFSGAGSKSDYSFDNDYFSHSDAEVAYALVRRRKPKRIVEIGSGNSTHLFRHAIRDGDLKTELVSIDPLPRRDIAGVADRIVRQRVEDVPSSSFSEELEDGDILFIDSSHELRIGNDVIKLALNIVPGLKKGVVVHFHDIFLPYEYPQNWILENRWEWNEQYLVQALLTATTQFSVLWPGHYLQRSLPNFDACFDQKGVLASSLWIEKIA
jgi:predicted O-methyltransferase YrrM